MSVDYTKVDFTSLRQSEQVQLEGQTTITTDGSGAGSVTISHNLGTAYQFLVFWKEKGAMAPWFYGFSASNSANSLTVSVVNFDANATITVIYKILYSPL